MPNGLYFIEEAKVRLGESLSTAPAQQTMLYTAHTRRVANRVAKASWCLYATASTDIIQGQVSYPIPHRPFRLDTVCINDGNGNVFPIAGITFAQADSMFYNWRNQNAPQQYQGVPQYYIDDGAKNYSLIPVPNYNQQAGLLVNGYYGVDKWWNMGDDCPLPEDEEYGEALIFGLCAERALELKKIDASYAAIQQDYERKFKESLRNLYRHALGANEARRSALPTNSKRLGAYQGWTWFGGS
jgi:hypothetical protein